LSLPNPFDLRLTAISQVDAEKVAKQLGLRLASIPPKFTEIRKRYNINVKVVNAGSLQRKKAPEPRAAEEKTSNEAGSPQKPSSGHDQELSEMGLAATRHCEGGDDSWSHGPRYFPPHRQTSETGLTELSHAAFLYGQKRPVEETCGTDDSYGVLARAAQREPGR
jgi:hypothetical protein